MDDYHFFPNMNIEDKGIISREFLSINISTTHDACKYVHELKYDYNSNRDDKLILFKEKKGTCTTKHAVIAGLAEELSIDINKMLGIYLFNEDIAEGANLILMEYNLPFIPMIHCFLKYKDYQVDLTIGNKNGKKKSIEEFIAIKEVEPFITSLEEYMFLKKIIKEKILLLKDMAGIKEKTILEARSAALNLLKKNIKN